MAAPVGVTSSARTPVSTTGKPRRSSADLVEVHRLAVRAVHARLGIREPREDSRRPLLHARCQGAALENREDVPERSLMPMSPPVDLDIDLGSPKHPLHDLTRPKLPPLQRQLAELRPERGDRHPCIQERGHDHVPRRPTHTIEVHHPHAFALRLNPACTTTQLISAEADLSTYSDPPHTRKAPRRRPAAHAKSSILVPAGAGGRREGSRDPFPPTGAGRRRAQMEPSRRGEPDASRVVPRPLPAPPGPRRHEVSEPLQ